MKHVVSPKIYLKNLSTLKKRFPRIYALLKRENFKVPFSYTVIKTKDNQINVLADLPDGKQVLFYADDDIYGETRKQLAAHILKKQDMLMFIGIGLGYGPLIAAKAYPDRPRIVIVERFLEVFDLAMRVMDLRHLLSYDRLDLVVGQQFSVEKMISCYEDSLYAGICRRITHLASRDIYGRQFISLEKEIDENIQTMFLNWNTIRKHGKDLLTNAMHNLPSLFEGALLGQLKNRFKGFPAILIW